MANYRIHNILNSFNGKAIKHVIFLKPQKSFLKVFNFFTFLRHLFVSTLRIARYELSFIFNLEGKRRRSSPQIMHQTVWEKYSGTTPKRIYRFVFYEPVFTAYCENNCEYRSQPCERRCYDLVRYHNKTIVLQLAPQRERHQD